MQLDTTLVSQSAADWFAVSGADIIPMAAQQLSLDGSEALSVVDANNVSALHDTPKIVCHEYESRTGWSPVRIHQVLVTSRPYKPRYQDHAQ